MSPKVKSNGRVGKGYKKKESVLGKRANPGRSLSLTSKDNANVTILLIQTRRTKNKIDKKPLKIKGL